MKALNIVTLVLVIVGAVNWGLVGLFQFDLVAALFGAAGCPRAGGLCARGRGGVVPDRYAHACVVWRNR